LFGIARVSTSARLRIRNPPPVPSPQFIYAKSAFVEPTSRDCLALFRESPKKQSRPQADGFSIADDRAIRALWS
jgi:hypothetical protein